MCASYVKMALGVSDLLLRRRNGTEILIPVRVYRTYDRGLRMCIGACHFIASRRMGNK